ncbi:iron chaperone [Companilactobacillus nodensis]|uniref:YdhG-like domain-containing protein n=1 Tax=Companilactobacillus nodensis DSM 19682 = JCM 14932 = NBRC 107160 TaxID=1423775 RepID=A0A0R1KP07_9LACO|nr:DUF1801 domain-containing protein [Companilactobacillus nodensis]KRK81047.1 hypothetical protein FD03_GL001183 [Companilactobacillus nodensis DSM 19682 = JCM 14932 = NBRC 107160]
MTLIEDYIKSAPEEQQAKLSEMYRILKDELPGTTEKMSYGMPTFYADENIVHFAGFKNHLGFYPTPSPIAKFTDELKVYKTSKGAIQFPYDQELPENLIRKIVKFRKSELKEKLQ